MLTSNIIQRSGNIQKTGYKASDHVTIKYEPHCQKTYLWTYVPSEHLDQGPVVQSIVSLTSLLRVITLAVLADSIHNILIFFAEKM